MDAFGGSENFAIGLLVKNKSMMITLEYRSKLSQC